MLYLDPQSIRNTFLQGGTWVYCISGSRGIRIAMKKTFLLTLICLLTIAIGAATLLSPVLNANAIGISLEESRTSCVAPCAVFFDATNTTHPMARPFHDIEYKWNFGDDDTATWAYGSQVGTGSVPGKKNRAFGPMAAHVFDPTPGWGSTPKTYTVTLTAFDGTNTSTVAQTITVTDPANVLTTHCFATDPSPDWTGCPADPANRHANWMNFTTALSTYHATGKRLLFRCGDTFTTVTKSGVISAAGPGTIGGFPIGCETKPIIQAGVDDNIIALSTNSHTPATTDWRIMDLALDGARFNTTAFGIGAVGGMTRLTVLRVDIYDLRFGFELNHARLDSINATSPKVPIWDQMFLVDSAIKRVRTDAGYGAFTSATRYALLGNFLFDAETFGPGAGGHLMRVPFGQKVVISNNEFNKSASSKALLTIRAPDMAGTATIPPGTFSEELLVSNNKFVGTATPELMGFVQGSNNVDMRLRNVIAERNWYVYGTGTQRALRNHASLATIRNNIVDTTAGTAHTAFSVSQPSGISFPITDQVSYYNNTVYSNSVTTTSFVMVSVGQTDSPTNLSVVNNLGFAPNHARPAAIKAIDVTGSFGRGGIRSNNSTDGLSGQIKLGPLPFIGATPTMPKMFAPADYAIGGGRPVPVYSDFFGVPRVGTYGMGAVKSRLPEDPVGHLFDSSR
jgi:hypothetical protein